MQIITTYWLPIPTIAKKQRHTDHFFVCLLDVPKLGFGLVWFTFAASPGCLVVTPKQTDSNNNNYDSDNLLYH